jgi:hypothetical protein
MNSQRYTASLTDAGSSSLKNERQISLQKISKETSNVSSEQTVKHQLYVSPNKPLTTAQFDLHVAMGASAALVKYLGVPISITYLT